jgi:iron complex outermembrane receptor protein
VGKLSDTVSAYASYSEGFRPNSGTDQEGNLFPPQKAEQVEIGLKGRLLSDRVNATIAVFDLEKDNVLELTVDGTVEITGIVRSRGVELDVVANPIEGWNILASYGHLDNEILGNSANVGNRVRNVAANTASLWTSYEFREGRFRGFGAGIGLFHSGDRFGENDNTWRLGDYSLVDAGLWYYIPTGRIGERPSQLKIQANVKNLTDERYYSAAGNIRRISPGYPRTYVVTVAYEF